MDDIKQLVDRAKAEFDPRKFDRLKRLLITPRKEQRECDYRDDGPFPCWVVAESEPLRVCLVHSEYGVTDEWGILSLDDYSLGMDAQWHVSLYHAFLNSKLWDGPMPEGYEAP